MEIENRLSEIEKKLDKLLARVNARVSWEEKTTSTGIVLTGGPTTVERFGVILGSTLVQVAMNQASIVFIVRREDTNDLAVMDASSVKVLKD